MAQRNPAAGHWIHQREPPPAAACRPTPPRAVKNATTAPEIDNSETEARWSLASYFRKDLPLMNSSPVRECLRLEEAAFQSERVIREEQLLEALREDGQNFDQKTDIVNGLRQWLERVQEEIQKVDQAVEHIDDHVSRLGDYSGVAQRMDEMFGKLFVHE